MTMLSGKKGLIFGIANENSIAYGCAKAFHEAGAELAVAYGHPASRPFVEPLAKALQAPIATSCNVEASGELEALFETIDHQWGRLDFLLHAIAFCPAEDLHAPVIDCSKAGFALAMSVSCHSFLRMAKLARPLMKDGGTMLTLSYYGAERAIENYNIMGPVKAALQSCVKYMAADLGQHAIRVNALSPGPIQTRAASGIAHFDALLEKAAERSPERQLVTIDDVGAYAAFLASDSARHVTGNIAFVDAGIHAIA